jgi:hypothetical protein
MSRLEARMLLISCGSRWEDVRLVFLQKSLSPRCTSRFQQLNDSPHSDMLESRVGTCEEAEEVLVHPAVRLVPDVIESTVVVSRCSTI